MSTADVTRTALDAEILETWIAQRREIIVREGVAVRAGPNATIEVQSVNYGTFLSITSPNGKREFENIAQRDYVLARLQGETR